MTLVDMTQAGPFSFSAFVRPQPGDASRPYPSVRTLRPVGPLGDCIDRQAWLREMERAQAIGWFQPFNGNFAAADHGTPTKVAALRSLTTTLPPVICAELIRHNIPTAGRVAESQDLPLNPGSAGAPKNAVFKAMQPNALSVECNAGESFEASPSALDGCFADLVSAPDTKLLGTERHLGEGHGNGSDLAIGPPIAPDLKPGSFQGDGLCAEHLPYVPLVLDSFDASPFQKFAQSMLTLPVIAVVDMKDGNRQGSAGIGGTVNGLKNLPAAVSDRPATRVHAIWTEDGLNLWLGMNGSAPQVRDQASLIVGNLYQMLKEHQQRLNRVICNGSVLFDAKTSPAVQPRGFSAELERHAPDQKTFQSRSCLFQKETS